MEQSGFPPSELKKFTDSGRVIAGAVGTSVEVWMRAEVGVILKRWAGAVKVSKIPQADRTALVKTLHLARRVAFGSSADRKKGSLRPGTASINLGLLRGDYGKVYYRTRKLGRAMGASGLQDTHGPNFAMPRKHILSADWPNVHKLVGVFRVQLEAMRAAGRMAIGLSRQSVVQIADQLGIDLLKVPGLGISGAGLAKARAAIASTGNYYQNGFGQQERGATNKSITIINRYPQVFANKMDAALFRIIQGRILYFERNLAEGTFLSARRAARAYPYVEILKNAA